jgi:hypothetical protein
MKDNLDKGKPMWAVMKAFRWANLQVHGIELTCPKSGPHRLVPLFNTRKQAVAFNGGKDDCVFEVKAVEASDEN